MATYQFFRRKAEKLCDDYMDYVEKAEAAHRRGMTRTAENYRAEARKIYDEVKKEHKIAAENIFQHNNRYRKPEEVDLHGLHMDEAEEKVRKFLHGHRNYEGILTIITGMGNHSEGRIGKVKERILDFFENSSYTFRVPKYNKGTIEVKMG